MKRIFMLSFLFILFHSVFSQTFFNYNKYINGYWGEWEDSNIYASSGYVMQGSYDEFIIYDYSDHPSQYIMKVKILDIDTEMDRKLRKEMIKSGKWFEHEGIVEYYTYTYKKGQKFKDIIPMWPYAPDASFGDKQTVSARILIKPYKKRPETYNIFFENIGLGIDIK